MIRWLIAGSLRFRFLVVAAGIVLLIVGVAAVREMSVDVLPEFAPPTVEVQTEALGLAPTEVEQLITVPLEQDLLNGIPFLDRIRSTSLPGLSSVELVFKRGTDPFVARQVVQERLAQAHGLPNVSKPPQMLPPVSSESRVLIVGLSSKALSLIRLSVLARWTIRPRLMSVPGVANVAIWGQRERQLQVQVDPQQLARDRVSLLQVIETTANALWVSPLSFVEASTPGTGGFIETPQQRLGVQHISPIVDAADLAKVSVEGTGGRRLRLADVSQVVEDHQPLIGDAIVDGGPGLLLVVQKFPGASTVSVTRGVEKAIAALRPGLPGVGFDTRLFRSAGYVERSLHNLAVAIVAGALLVLLLLAGVLGRWRTAVIGLVTVPLSLVTAGFVLAIRGETVNALTLVGLVAALAVVVDDAVLAGEPASNERRGAPRASRIEALAEATHRLRVPAANAAAMAAIAVIPLFFLVGVPGQLFPPVALSYLLALAASLVVALTVAPALTMLLPARAQSSASEPRAVAWLQKRYETFLGRVVRRPRWALVAAILLAGAGLATVPFLHGPLLPKLAQSDLLVTWRAAPGTSLPAMRLVTTKAVAELRAIPGIRVAGAHVGRAITSDQVVDVNSGELWFSIDPAADRDATLAAVQRVLARYPGIDHAVETYTDQRLAQTATGGSDDLVVRVYGQDLGTLHRKAEEISRLASRVPGVAARDVQAQVEVPTIEIAVDLAEAERRGITPGDVRRAATTLISGLQVGSLYEGQRIFDVVVVGVPATRRSVETVRSLLIDTPDGGHVRLADVAHVSVRPAPALIQHDAVSRYVDVGLRVRGRDSGDVATDVRRALQAVHFPLEYHAELVSSDSGTPLGRLLALAAAVAAALLVLLQAALGSWRLAGLGLVALALPAAGGLVAVAASGGELSYGAVMGLLAVLAIGARATTLLAGRFGRLAGEGATKEDAARRAAGERFLTAAGGSFAAALALLPLAILGAGPGRELTHPLALVVLGGLLAAALVNLVILPAAFARLGRETGP